MTLSPQVPDLAALEILLSVARHGSLNAVAQEVGVSQQAVSARISSMEAQTGIHLVDRTKRGSTLTRSGEVVAEWATRVLGAAAQLDAGLASLRADHRATLRISASLTVAEQLLPGWLVSLQIEARARGAASAQIELSATNSDRVVDDVRCDRADLGFVEGPTAPRGVRSRVVAHDELVVVVRPDHPWSRRRRPVTPAELAATSLVTREAGSGTRDALTDALRTALGPSMEQAPSALALSTAAAVRAAVQAGAGPAALSRLTVADDLDAKRLVQVGVTGLRLTRSLRAVWTGGATPTAGPARDLLAHIRSTRPAGAAR